MVMGGLKAAIGKSSREAGCQGIAVVSIIFGPAAAAESVNATAVRALGSRWSGLQSAV